MVKNYLLIALRNLLRHKAYSVINIVGLAIGMACCILIAQYIRFEMSYDQFHSKSERIYRIMRETKSGGTSSFGTGISGNLAPALLESYPEIEYAVRAWFSGSWMMHKDKGNFQNVTRIDKGFIKVFDFPFAKGNPETAFKEPFSIVLTEETAQEYFGNEDPIGKTVSFKDRNFAPDYTVTGILKNMPDNSTIHVDALITTISEPEPISTWNRWSGTYSWRPIQTFIVLPEGYNPKDLEQKLPALMEQHMGAEIREKNAYHLQPLLRTHLYSRADYNLEWYSDINRIYTFALVAFFILLIACINFMNLATARSVHRAREVGMRKVVGAYRKQLMGQFLGESIFLACIALPLAFALAQLALPAFAGYIGSDITANYIDLIPAFVGFAIAVGLLAGSYPAFYLSNYRPVDVLKGTLKSGSKGTWFRKGLVVFQFGASIILIIGTIVVYNQLSYLSTKDLGFNKDQMVLLPLFLSDRETTVNHWERLGHRHQMVKETFLKHLNITQATALRYPTGLWGGMIRVVAPEGEESGAWRMHVNEVDETFFDVFGIDIVAGRNFSADIVSDSTSAFILNETAVKQLGWGNPIGKKFGFGDENMHGVVVGVIKDFHHNSLREKIKPVVFCMRRSLFTYLGLKVRPENMQETITFMETTWKQFIHNRPFNYWFLDEQLRMSYFQEQRFAQAATTFSGLAIFVACLGLLGLAAFTAEQRTKEIGIRKVLGATTPNIITLLSHEFLLLVLIANIIAWPVAYTLMNRWLQDFAYHIDLSILTFIAGGLLALLIALITVSALAFKAARSNPIDALRYE